MKNRVKKVSCNGILKNVIDKHRGLFHFVIDTDTISFAIYGEQVLNKVKIGDSLHKEINDNRLFIDTIL